MGREYVAQLLGRGVAKVYAAARDPRTIDGADPRVVPLQLDVTYATSVAGAAAVASDVSVLINNAGIYRATSVLDPDTSNLREELETNLFGPLATASTFADRIAERSGAIVNVASVLAWMPGGASYGVSKAAMWRATDSMRIELGPRGVQVLGVYVGLVEAIKRVIGLAMAALVGRIFFQEPLTRQKLIALGLMAVGVSLILFPTQP